ncbi:protein phosphatase 2C domain-containing protein [soil metagenome]
MLELDVAILNERGGRDYNEDSCGHWHAEGRLCCVLADGAGGHGGGQVASRLAVERTLSSFADNPSSNGSAMHELVCGVNRAVLAGRSVDPQCANMHSTLVCLAVDYVRHRAHWAYAGDSRLYWFREGRVIEHTTDHSVVQALVDGGMLSAQQAREHPRRSELRSALGSREELIEIDHSGAARVVQAGDVFLLCSDGVWECVSDAVLESTLTESTTVDEWLDAIEAAVGAAANPTRQHDNFSAVAIAVRAATDSGEE